MRHTVAQPGAVMVKDRHAVVALPTVVAPRRLVDVARRAHPPGALSQPLSRVPPRDDPRVHTVRRRQRAQRDEGAQGGDPADRPGQGDGVMQAGRRANDEHRRRNEDGHACAERVQCRRPGNHPPTAPERVVSRVHLPDHPLIYRRPPRVCPPRFGGGIFHPSHLAAAAESRGRARRNRTVPRLALTRLVLRSRPRRTRRTSLCLKVCPSLGRSPCALSPSPSPTPPLTLTNPPAPSVRSCGVHQESSGSPRGTTSHPPTSPASRSLPFPPLPLSLSLSLSLPLYLCVRARLSLSAVASCCATFTLLSAFTLLSDLTIWLALCTFFGRHTSLICIAPMPEDPCVHCRNPSY